MKTIIIESLIHVIFRFFSIKQYMKKEHIYSQKSKDEWKNRKRLIVIVSGSIYENNKIVYEKGSFIGEEIFQDYNKDISVQIVAYPDWITLEASIDNLAKVMKIVINKEKPFNILKNINKLKKMLFRMFQKIFEKGKNFNDLRMYFEWTSENFLKLRIGVKTFRKFSKIHF